MTSTFCKYLTNQARIEYGRLRPCCWFTETADVGDPTAVANFQQALGNITDWETAQGRCDECHSREAKGLFSPRLESLTKKVFDGVEDNSITSVEIQIDKDCNGACLICGPWNSTTWEKYENKLNNIPIKEITDSKTASYRLVDQVNNSVDFSAAREVLFLGGEPLRTDSHVRLLKNIQHPEQTILKYTTNGSYQPDSETLEVWGKFKKVLVHLSIDGIKEHFNYLRWPLQWHQVESNLEFLISLSNTNIQVSPFSYTTTPFSLFYHDSYDAWAKTFFAGTGLDAGKMFDRPWQPRGDTPMALSAVPPKLQKVIREKYGPEHSITKLLEPFDPKQYRRFMEYIQTHDKHRQTNWFDVFPEMQSYYQ